MATVGKMATLWLKLGKTKLSHSNSSHPGITAISPKISQQSSFGKVRGKAKGRYMMLWRNREKASNAGQITWPRVRSSVKS